MKQIQLPWGRSIRKMVPEEMGFGLCTLVKEKKK